MLPIPKNLSRQPSDQNDSLLANSGLISSVSNETSLLKNHQESLPTPSNPVVDLSNYLLLSKHTEILNTRETQLASLAKNNAKLQELNDNLENEKTVLNNELTNYIEKTQVYKSEVNKLTERANTAEQLQKIISEKEDSIRGLLAEGEKLSKQQMQHQQANKKLRIKNKEYENENNQVLARCNTAESEANKLREQLKEITEREMREREQGRRMNSTVDQQSSEIQNLQFKLNEALEKQRSLQSTADSAYKEMADLNKQMHELQSNQTDDLKKLKKFEEEKREEIYQKALKEFENEKSMLMAQISDAQTTVERNENNFNRKENSLKVQINDLQDRLQEAEQRQSELSTAMTASTRPLLRQIEQLQLSLTQQQSTADEVEKSLTSRLRELQGDVSAQKERQRQAVEAAMDAHSKCTAMEASQILIKEEKTRIEGELDEIKTNFDELKMKDLKQRTELEKYHSNSNKEKAETESKILILQQQLDQERNKLQTAMESIKEKERQWALLGRAESAMSRSSPTMSGYNMRNDGSDTDTIGPAPGDCESMSEMGDIGMCFFGVLVFFRFFYFFTLNNFSFKKTEAFC